MHSISAHELKQKLSDGDIDEVLIDVREPSEYKSMRIAEAKNIPLARIGEVAEKLKGIGTVYVHCARGGRSAQACSLLENAGVHVVNVEGGIDAWEKAGLGVVRTGKQTMPIIRQVMIAAGSMVFIGVVLGTWVTPWWYALSAFVGCGLVFAGSTGICVMSSVLERMPWNRGE